MGKKTLHGIDLTAPDGIEKLMAFHRRTFGEAVMEGDADADQDEDQDGDDTDADDVDDAEDQDSDDGADDLGDKGKKALDAMKAKVKASRIEARDAKAENARWKAEKDSSGKEPEEQKLQQARDEATAQATTAANRRILRSEIKAAAGSKFTDPSDALAYLDLEEFDVDDNGDVDEEAIADALADLLEKKPYLAAQGGKVQFDSARGKPRPGAKLTAKDLDKMTPAQVAKAYDEGRIQL